MRAPRSCNARRALGPCLPFGIPDRERARRLRSPWTRNANRGARLALLHRRRVVREVALDRAEVELRQDRRVRLVIEQEFERASDQLVHVAAAVALELGA